MVKISSKIISIAFQSQKRFPLKKNEIIDLSSLQQECLKHGVKSVMGKGRLSIKMNNINFLLFANGKIARCYSPDIDSMIVFDETTADFFWKKFAADCVKKKEVIHNGK